MARTRGGRFAHLLAVLSCLLLPLAMVSSWVAGFVTDTDRYVATVGPLAEEPVVVTAVERNLERLALQAIDLPRQRTALASFLQQRGIEPPPGAQAAPLTRLLEDMAADAVREAVAQTVHRVVDSPRFVEAWEAANRSAHEQLVAVLRDADTGMVSDDGRVSIELATLLNAVLENLGSALPVPVSTVPDIEAAFPLLEASDLARARVGYRVLDAAGFWLPLLWLVTMLTALLIAPSRRRVLGVLGYGALVALLVTAGLLSLARRLALDSVPAANRALSEAVWHQLVTPLHDAVRIGLVVAVLLVALRWVTGPGDRAVAVRAAARSGVGTLPAGGSRVLGTGLRTAVVLLLLLLAAWVVW